MADSGAPGVDTAIPKISGFAGAAPGRSVQSLKLIQMNCSLLEDGADVLKVRESYVLNLGRRQSKVCLRW
jgi:hypothetical protein